MDFVLLLFDYSCIAFLYFFTFRSSHNPQWIEVIWQMRRADDYCTMIVRHPHATFISSAKVDNLDVFPARKVEIV